jgi:hypothetical protein
MAVDDELVRIAKGHQAQLLAIRATAAAAVGAAWDRLMNRPDEGSARRFIGVAAPTLVASQTAAAIAVLAFIPAYVGHALGERPDPLDLEAGDFLTPRGVTTATVLERAIVTMRTKLARGATLDDAVAAGRARAVQTAATEPMLTARAAGAEAMRREPAVVGFRRVPDGNACKFCLLVATQRYHDGDLMPLHPGCGCTVAPIVGERDPGRVIDRDTLKRLKADGVVDDITRRRQQKRVAVHSHGELGPTLYAPGHNFDAA